MITKNLSAIALVLAMGYYPANAQTSEPSSDVLEAVQIIIEAPKIAERQSVIDVVEELAADGFSYIEIMRTFLGRARIVAYSATEIREIILNATTGEVLRDLAEPNSEGVPANAFGLQNAAERGNNRGGLGLGVGQNAGGGDRN